MSRKLDVGSGAIHEDGWESIDKSDAYRPDHVHDLTTMPWPFACGTFDELRCSHVLEHIDRSLLIAVMNEMHRILKPGGTLMIEAPVAGHWKSFADPTHVSYIVPQTFLYFTINAYQDLYGMEKWDLLPAQVDENGSVFQATLDDDGGVFRIELQKPARELEKAV